MKDFAMNTEFILKFVGEHENFIIFIFTMLVIPGLKDFLKDLTLNQILQKFAAFGTKKTNLINIPTLSKMELSNKYLY